jgi:DNA-binding response OmpR family regulator
MRTELRGTFESVVDVVALLGSAAGPLRRAVGALEDHGYRVRLVDRPGEAWHYARSQRVGALVFEEALADPDFLTRMRRDCPGHVLVAATHSSASVAPLLKSGADEALHPGMSERELAARMIAALQRGGSASAAPLGLGALQVDPLHAEALWEGRDLMLTRREREVLEVLLEHAGRTVRREILYRRVWGYAMARGDRGVDVNVKRLRRKLEATAGSALQIRTQPGVGYRLELVAEALGAGEPVTAP